MLLKIKNKLFRTRQLVKLAREDLATVKEKLKHIEESVCAADGALAWSPLVFERWKKLTECFQFKKLLIEKKERAGCDADGGYVVPADWRKTGILISLGIGPENTFDMHFAQAGIQVDAYDHSISRLPKEHPRISWIKQKVVEGPNHSQNEISLQEILEKLPEGVNASLKLDIEGWEIPALLACPENLLRRLRFIVAEFHGIASAIAEGRTASIEASWRKLSSYFDVVHFHGNNSGGGRVLGGALIPELIEVTLVNRKFYQTVDGFDKVSSEFDRPNIPGKAEIQFLLPNEYNAE